MLRAFRSVGVGLVCSVAWLTGCGGSGAGGGASMQGGCEEIAGFYTEGSGTCGMPFSCEVDADTCEASCSDDSEVKVTPNEDGFTFTPDGGGNCTVKVNGSTFSGLCTQGATVCKLAGSYSDDGFAGTGGTGSGGTGGSNSGGSNSGGTGAISSGGSGGTATFYCDNGSQVPVDYVCDGYSDCRSDEYNCAVNGYLCDSGTTIPEAFVCDGYYDCSTADDELDCGVDTYTCADGFTVVPASYRCDGSLQCPSGDDEYGCGTGYECEGTTTVISTSQVCDGTVHCTAYGDDEEGCGYACSDGTTVIPESSLCDGYSDCPVYYDDEDGCPGTYVCDDGYVIPESALCDGTDYDCESNEDENLCAL